jgi:threonine dehydratase
VIDGAPNHAETQRLAADYAAVSGALLLHPYDTGDVVAGAGVVALEIEEQYPRPHTIAVAVGGGGLIGGVTVVGRERGFRVIGVEPVGAPTLNAALQHGSPVPVVVNSRAADSLGAPQLGAIAFDICAGADVASLLVTDDQLAAARGYLWDEFRLVVELAAAAPVAAFQADPDPFGTDGIPVLVLCGANTSADIAASDSGN